MENNITISIKIESDFDKNKELPQTKIELNAHDAETMLKLLDKLEDHDDVQKVYANFEISEDVMERITAD